MLTKRINVSHIFSLFFVANISAKYYVIRGEKNLTSSLSLQAPNFVQLSARKRKGRAKLRWDLLLWFDLVDHFYGSNTLHKHCSSWWELHLYGFRISRGGVLSHHPRTKVEEARKEHKKKQEVSKSILLMCMMLCLAEFWWAIVTALILIFEVY